ncbi:MAG TPA: glutaminyl-peptide cyclotransferase [Dehalococcoidia bacterium]|nr:glutaminyl-peptide cyclotransferase [Dehalococcoidia bacterium]
MGSRTPLLLAFLLAVAAAGCTGGTTSHGGMTVGARHYTYEIVHAYPHDRTAFTQGLACEDGLLYEGTGLRGRSTLRKVQLETGVVLDYISMPGNCFGEGITLCGDTVVQLTWRSRVGFVYDRDFNLVREFSYDTEGWGITYDGSRLIMSDGTSTLYFLEPETFSVAGSVEVNDGGSAVAQLNELEFIDGLVYANVWKTDRIALINPADGQVVTWLDLTGLLDSRPVTGPTNVLNGIAYDALNGRLFVTGKLWPWLFEISMVPQLAAHG